MAETSSNTALVGEIVSVKLNPKLIKFSLLGFIFGIFLSAFLVLIIGAFKDTKEEKAITL